MLFNPSLRLILKAQAGNNETPSRPLEVTRRAEEDKGGRGEEGENRMDGPMLDFAV